MAPHSQHPVHTTEWNQLKLNALLFKSSGSCHKMLVLLESLNISLMDTILNNRYTYQRELPPSSSRKKKILYSAGHYKVAYGTTFLQHIRSVCKVIDTHKKFTVKGALDNILEISFWINFIFQVNFYD